MFNEFFQWENSCNEQILISCKYNKTHIDGTLTKKHARQASINAALIH